MHRLLLVLLLMLVLLQVLLLLLLLLMVLMLLLVLLLVHLGHLRVRLLQLHRRWHELRLQVIIIHLKRRVHGSR